MKTHEIALTVNGTRETVSVPAGMTLLELLREKLYLTGPKEGCGAGGSAARALSYSMVVR